MSNEESSVPTDAQWNWFKNAEKTCILKFAAGTFGPNEKAWTNKDIQRLMDSHSPGEYFIIHDSDHRHKVIHCRRNGAIIQTGFRENDGFNWL